MRLGRGWERRDGAGDVEQAGEGWAEGKKGEGSEEGKEEREAESWEERGDEEGVI